MSKVTYRGVEMNVLVTNEFQETPLNSDDQSTLVAKEYLLDISATIHQDLIAYIAGVNAPVANQGTSPTVTWKAIEDYMMQPRGTLKVEIDGTLIESPREPYAVDARNGPRPEMFSIIRVVGLKQLIIRFRIRTWLVAEPSEVRSSSSIRTHRWRRIADTDEVGLSTIVTEGEAVFRTDLLTLFGQQPDWFRGRLFHAIPDKFKRKSIQASPSSDNTSFRYRIVDQEFTHGLTQGTPAMKVEAKQIGHYSKGGLWQAWHEGQTNAGSSFLSSFGGAASSGAQTGMSPSPTTGRPAGFGDGGMATLWNMLSSALGGLGSTASGMYRSQVPRLRVGVTVDAWGNTNHTRRQLEDLCLAIALSRLGTFNESVNQEGVVMHDLMGKYVHLELTYSFGPEMTLQAQVWNPLASGAAFAYLRSYFPDVETFGNIDVNGTTQPTITTRGTFIGQIIAQMLSSPNAEPPAPGNVNTPAGIV